VKKNQVKEKFDEAVEKILDTMETSGKNWVRSWSAASAGMPYNYRKLLLNTISRTRTRNRSQK